jgi:hypothetical protein
MSLNMQYIAKSLTGGYTPIKILRFAIMAFAIIDAAAHLYASPASYPLVTFWLEIEVAAFIVIGMVFLLGLKIWYIPSIVFTLFNLVVFLVSGVIAIPPISSAALVGHVQFADYSFGRAFSLAAWLFIIIVGTILLFVDKGSKLNDLLREDNN